MKKANPRPSEFARHYYTKFWQAIGCDEAPTLKQLAITFLFECIFFFLFFLYLFFCY